MVLTAQNKFSYPILQEILFLAVANISVFAFHWYGQPGSKNSSKFQIELNTLSTSLFRDYYSNYIYSL